MANDCQIEIICGCVIVRPLPGESGIPIGAIRHVARLLPRRGRGAVMDPDLGRIHGAVILAGSPDNLRCLRAAPETVGRAERMERALPEWLSSAARRWAVWGQQGRSSQAMFSALTGVVLSTGENGVQHPLDAADFRRCLLLADEVREIGARVPELAALSPEWRGLVASWDEIAAAFEKEAPGWREGRLAPCLTEMVQAATGDLSAAPAQGVSGS